MPCHFEFTDSRFVFAGKSYPGVPVLVDLKNQFVTPVCDYFRHLVLVENLRTTSAKTYADYIAHFWNFLESQELEYRDVGDKELIRWLNAQEAGDVSAQTRCARCDVIFDLYAWLELKGYVHHSVRIPGWNDDERFVPRLTSVPVRNSRHRVRRSSKFGIVSAVRPPVPGGDLQATPGADDLNKIYIAAHNEANSMLTERNHLLIDWYSQVGLRRHEWSALTVEQIPSWDTIHALQLRSEAHELRLDKTKGGRVRHVGVIPDLLEKTREYIEGSRTDIVARFKATKSGAYREPSEIFLSEKTGQPLTLTAITNMLTGWFRDAKVPGHGHRLRATYLTNLFEAEIAAEESRMSIHPGTKANIDFELILRKVAERAGHAHIESLRPYLTLARKRRLREPGTADPVTLQQQIDAKKQELAMLVHRVTAEKTALNILTRSIQ